MQSGSFQHCERERREEGDIKIIERERERGKLGVSVIRERL